MPVNIHMQTWFWYIKAGARLSRHADEPKTWDDFVADLDKLKAAGVIPLAFGGQPTGRRITFDAV